MARKQAHAKTTEIDTFQHKDKRANIPTEELRDFVLDEENSPQITLYSRDPSLDPQLVWKGKDEENKEDLTVPAVPLYIQEKIQPQAIIKKLLEEIKYDDSSTKAPPYQLNLYADFNGLPDKFEQRIDFYHHEQNWSNRMILGDSLLVMTSLAEKEGLKGKIQAIYIDPPYGIKFNSNWQVSTRKRNIADGKPESVTRQPEQIRAFRDTWNLGVHSYLSYLRDRLLVARELLTNTGSVFVQIGDKNVHLVRSLLDEVFGSENFISQITVQKMAGLESRYLKGASDYVLWYGKDTTQTKYRQLLQLKELGVGHGSGARYDQMISLDHQRLPIPKDQDKIDEAKLKRFLEDDWKAFQPQPLMTFGSGGSSYFEYEFEGEKYVPGVGKGWRTTLQGLDRLTKAGRIVKTGKRLRYVQLLDDFPFYEYNNVWTDIASPPNVVYVVQTHPKLIQRCLLMSTDPGDLVLDPTCGSGTTAYVAEQWGRRWITIDTSRVALTLARTRLMAATYPYYILADSPEGLAKTIDDAEDQDADNQEMYDIKKGFFYKSGPRVQLKSIGKDPEIDRIFEKWQLEMTPLLNEIHQASSERWREWEVPRSVEDDPQVSELVQRWWHLYRLRRKDMESYIAKSADAVLLYDKPYESSKRVRVSGPLTVESLSPHRILPADEDLDSNVSQEEAQRQRDFATIIIDNLRHAGVQNTRKEERLRFETLEPYAGKWLHAVGTSISSGKTNRIAISIGPEHGTVGPSQIKEAAKEAVQGIGFDLLLVCGFTFDPYVSEETTRYGALAVRPVRMNSDLSMGDELLKKTGAGNLFTIFGEPDLEIRPLKDGNIDVELKGVDVFDPTTGQIRDSSTEDIACWFIDTNYDDESFFVRHAYFTGAGEPYEKLKQALRAEISEDAWRALYTTKSMPFAPPVTGKIAIKVINHYGDEVLKVYSIGHHNEPSSASLESS